VVCFLLRLRWCLSSVDPWRLFCPFLIFVAGGGRSGRFAYQLVDEKSGWILLPTCLGGYVPRWVVSLPGESKVSAVLEASVLYSSGEVMADDHFMPGRSVDVRYADVFDILLVEAIKNCCVSSSERGTASSYEMLRSPATTTTGCSCKG
jgi:hypothetical protein